jgi:hypothetical protein
VRRSVLRGLRAVSIWVVALGVGMSQTSPKVTQQAKDAVCSNIVALAGNVNVNCSSLTREQRRIIDAVPALLRKILANQMDPVTVNAKLDEIRALVARGATSPEAVAQGLQMYAEGTTTSPKAAVRKVFETLDDFLDQQEKLSQQRRAQTVHTTQGVGESRARLEKENLQLKQEIEQSRRTHASQLQLDRIQTFLDINEAALRSVKMINESKERPDQDVVDLYGLVYAKLVERELEQLRSKGLAVDDLVLMNKSIASLSELYALRDRLKTLYESLAQ